ncbi:DUF305 domain-containing protein [Nocardioides convexus]|uniref:DUF305 domain-containing protein n=1 Tax=Nocardioides convexus TaxID=2712224 RepID=UPI0024185033|nr:DUF305 domain-containing protein [Nocardioides convexus]
MYVRFGLMIATSTVVMFVLTYTNAFSIDHVRWSEERLYMALLMGAAMALVMLAFMRSMMYRNRTINLVIVALALALGGTALYLSRSQTLVDDQAYMRGMIPHHSIAILTSERAQIDDVRVREPGRRHHQGAAQGDQGDGLADRGHRTQRPGHHRGGSPATARP